MTAADFSARAARRRAARDRIQLDFRLYPEGYCGTLRVQQPKGNIVAKASGYNRALHNCGADIHLLGILQQCLQDRCNLSLTRKYVWKDKHFAHIFGDEHSVYLRTRIRDKPNKSVPHIWIIDPEYVLRFASKPFNAGEELQLQITGDIFQERGKPARQPNWADLVYAGCCSATNVTCSLHEYGKPRYTTQPITTERELL